MFGLNKDIYKKVSYAQSGEDLIVKFIFDAIGVSTPSYLDIGAHHPFHLSNSALFYQLGSRGINVEPDINLFKAFVKHRKQDINLNCGVSENEGELMFNVMNAPTLSTFSKDEADRLVKENGFSIIKTIPVTVTSVQSLLNKYCKNIFPDFLNLDVEGVDEEIIKSINYDQTKPIVICLETITYSETGRGKKNHSIISYLESKGYMVYADTYINTIFVLEEKWLK